MQTQSACSLKQKSNIICKSIYTKAQIHIAVGQSVGGGSSAIFIFVVLPSEIKSKTERIEAVKPILSNTGIKRVNTILEEDRCPKKSY